MSGNGVQSNLVELAEHFYIPLYGVYRPLGRLECDFVNKEPKEPSLNLAIVGVVFVNNAYHYLPV